MLKSRPLRFHVQPKSPDPLKSLPYYVRHTPMQNSKNVSASQVKTQQLPKPIIEKCGSNYPTKSLNQLDCSSIFNGKGNLKYGEEKLPVPSDDEFYRQANSCAWILNQLDPGYYVSEEEKQFPLAFAISVYQSPYQIFRFLKVIYRPHNLYCLHYDKKSTEAFKKLMITIAECLPNVIVPKKIVDVVWGWHTIVDAQMNCLNDTFELRNRFPWQYAITLCGKEVPLRTNKEMVNTLRKLNGTSGIELKKIIHREKANWLRKHVLNDHHVRRSKEKLQPVPFNLKIVKSPTYVSLPERFVNYLLQNNTAIQFQKFLEDTRIPDEHFVATLAVQKGIQSAASISCTLLYKNVHILFIDLCICRYAWWNR